MKSIHGFSERAYYREIYVCIYNCGTREGYIYILIEEPVLKHLYIVDMSVIFHKVWMLYTYAIYAHIGSTIRSETKDAK